MEEVDELNIAIAGKAAVNRRSDQPLLWREPAVDRRVSDIRWSYSRRSVLEQCPRRYYYEYYGGSSASSDPQRDLISRLKNVQTRHELAGNVLHTVIAGYFRKTADGKDSPEDLSRKAWGAFRKVWDSSESVVNQGIATAALSEQAVLHEYYYPLPNAGELCLAAEDRLVRAVVAFATEDSFSEFRSWRDDATTLVESRIHVEHFPCVIDGRLDLAHRSDDRIAVVDWKLGESSDGGDDSLQLAAYAMWAAQHFGRPPETVAVFKAYLTSRCAVPFVASSRVIERTRARILQDAERMAALDDYGCKAMVGAFTACAQRRVCANCAFLEICTEGRAVVHD